jgi:hypothetical protein
MRSYEDGICCLAFHDFKAHKNYIIISFTFVISKSFKLVWIIGSGEGRDLVRIVPREKLIWNLRDFQTNPSFLNENMRNCQMGDVTGGFKSWWSILPYNKNYWYFNSNFQFLPWSYSYPTYEYSKAFQSASAQGYHPLLNFLPGTIFQGFIGHCIITQTTSACKVHLNMWQCL